MANVYSNQGSVVRVGNVSGDVNTETNITVLPIEPADPIGFGLHTPDINFTGRLDELKYLKEVTANQPGHTPKHPIIVVSGLGGIGKTQLVRKFIHENRSSYENVIWINSQEREMIDKDFEKLANDYLKISTDFNGKKIDCNSLIEIVLNKLSAAPTLIVFDNADKTENTEFVFSMGTLRIKPQIVITSRIQDWSDFICRIKLKVFESEDALKYVSKALDDPEYSQKDSDEDKETLVEKLQKFPLALRQATAHIKHKRKEDIFHISDYIGEYNSFQMELLDSGLFKRDFSNEYKETTFTTWKVTVAAINACEADGELALTILQVISYFDPEHIRRDIFFNLKLSSVQHVKSAVRLLVNYSMLESKDMQSVLSVHRLVQEVIKIDLENVTDMTKATLWNGLHLISEMKEHENFEETHEHGISVFISALKFEELIHEFKSFPAMILQSLMGCNKFFRAENFGGQILQPLTTCLGEDHPDTLITKSTIAASHRTLGQHAEAVRMYQEVFEKQRCNLGEDHPDTLTTKSNMAYSYDEMGKHSEAVRMYKEVFEGVKAIFGEDLSTKSNIATSYIALGEHSKAITMYQDVFEGMTILLGEDHPDTLTTKSNIAYLYSAQGKYSEALEMYQVVFDKQTKILGEDHPDTLNRKFNIACLYGVLGKHSEALEIYQEVHEKQKTILGEYHPHTLATKNSIASSQRALGNYSEALQIHQEVFEKQRINLGEDHTKTLDSKFHIAFSLSALDKYSEALLMYHEIFGKQMRILGDDHPDTLITKSNIAISYCKMGQHPEGIQMYQEVLEQQNTVLGEDHPDTLTTKSNIASAYSALGQHSEALEMYQNVFDKIRKILGEDHPKTIATKFNIAITLSALGENSEALRMFEEQKTTLGEDHPYTLRLKSNIALSHCKMGKHSEAIRMYQEVFEKQKCDLGEDHPDTLTTKFNIAASHRDLGKHAEAIRMYQEVCEKQKRDLGEDHPDTLTTKSKIASSHRTIRKHFLALQIKVGLTVLLAGLIVAFVLHMF